MVWSIGFKKSLFSGHPVIADTAPLPRAAQEIADIIGRDRALFLIGQLPRCYVHDKRWQSRPGSKGSCRVILYVPKRLKPDHRLVQILGWNDAVRLVEAFGGEIICPPPMTETLYRPFRDAGIVHMICSGVPECIVAEWFEITTARVRQVLEAAGIETPKEAKRPANDNDPRLHNTQARSDATNGSIRD